MVRCAGNCRTEVRFLSFLLQHCYGKISASPETVTLEYASSDPRRETGLLRTRERNGRGNMAWLSTSTVSVPWCKALAAR